MAASAPRARSRSPTDAARADMREVKRDTLAKHSVRATFVGLREGREGMLRVFPPRPAKTWAFFRIDEYIEHQQMGQYGKKLEVGKEFGFAIEDALSSEQKRTIFGQGGLLHPDDAVELAWNHDYVTTADAHGGEASMPERPLTKLIKISSDTLAKHDVRAKYLGMREGLEGMMRVFPPRANKMWASFEIIRYEHYEKLGNYGGEQRKLGSEFSFVPAEATQETNDALGVLSEGNVVELAWDHNYLTKTDLLHGGVVKTPERKVTKLVKVTEEVLSKHMAKAKYVGLQEGRESMMRCWPPRQNQSWASFQIVEYISYEKPGKYGDAKLEPDDEFRFLPESQCEDIQDIFSSLKPGQDVVIAWEHTYVTKTDGTHTQKAPERQVIKLQVV
eukprot:TRINITY_DN20703_c0_g2_i1.p1 TRINITY_DN20703_c0_g2~~TRINITY_DN20703_c0_g2_i1.p1  ORF type:complete len:389 (+),score=80.30 TRINITY_DN20703_c0_g2_i1:39-1205(+)